MFKRFLVLLALLATAGSAMAQKGGSEDQFKVIQVITITKGPLPQDPNDKQDFTVTWGINALFAKLKFESFDVEFTVKRADGSVKSDTKQVNGSARDVVFKFKGNSEPQTALAKITATSTAAFSCVEKFSGQNLSVAGTSGNLCLVDFLGVAPLNAEEQKKKQTFDVKWSLISGTDPARISGFHVALDVQMDNNTTESDQKSPDPAAGAVTLKVKSPGAPVSATATATGAISRTDTGFGSSNFGGGIIKK